MPKRNIIEGKPALIVIDIHESEFADPNCCGSSGRTVL